LLQSILSHTTYLELRFRTRMGGFFNPPDY
jgi:hypothetical protein